MSPPKNPRPIGLQWRASTSFIIATVAVGLFTDLFLYGLVVPVLPRLLRERLGLADDQIQSYVSALLAAYAGASVVFSVPVGVLADRTSARRAPFIAGLVALVGATLMLALGRSVAVLVLARVLQGISGAVVWTVGLAMIMDTVGPENLGKVIGTIFSFISTGELAAPVLGGLLKKKTGDVGVFGLSVAILVIDIILRALVIEKKVAAQYDDSYAGASNAREHGSRDDAAEDGGGGEEEPLLPKKDEEQFLIAESKYKIFQSLPILYCLSNPRLLVALLVAFVQATLLATFDATIPTEAEDLFDFDTLNSGLLFVALDIPYLLLGPVAGWAVDKYGPKPAAVIGFGYLVPVLILLRLPTDNVVSSTKGNIILYSALLALNGIGLALIGSPSIVEASDVVQKYDKANPGLFGKNGPYAQLYGFNSVVFSSGLTVGPLLSGAVRDRAGYAVMNAVVAAIAGVTAVLSFWYIGGRPRFWRRE